MGFFALVADDQPMFERLLAWTENNLAAGDLTSRLPAWLWGQNSQNNWDILDPNSASDADILIAYNLLEAGRLWGNRRYLIMGTLLLQRIAQEEVMDIPGLGQMLLPGKLVLTMRIPGVSTQVIYRHNYWHDFPP